MRKIGIVLIYLFIVSSCTTVERLSTDKKNGSGNNDLIHSVLDLNLSKKNYVIQKLELSINYNGEIQKVLANLKHSSGGDWLVSIRNFTGIEGLRILLSGDSVKVNDRINQRYYYGSSKYLVNHNGFRKEMADILMGDLFINESNLTRSDCDQNTSLIKSIYKNYELKYTVSCKDDKVLTATIKDSRGNLEISAIFSQFRTNQLFTFPRKGNIEIRGADFSVSYKIKDIKEFEGIINDLTASKNYEKVVLK